jgi:gamma-glutamyltranspeptidase/glutathione hydrolase
MGEDSPDLGPKGVLRLEAGVPQTTRQALIDPGWPMGRQMAALDATSVLSTA